MMVAIALISFFIFVISPQLCYSYKALVIMPTPSKSHSMLGHGIVKQLLNDGNEVTYITAFEYNKVAPPTLRQIDVSNTIEALPQKLINLNEILDQEVLINDHFTVKELFTNITLKAAENENVQNLLGDPKEHFDVVILEYMDNDFLAGIAAVFDCPLIWTSPMGVHSDILSRIDKISNPSYVADFLSANIPPFTFRQRVEEVWSLLVGHYWYYTHFDNVQSKAYNRLIAPFILKRGRQPPTFYDIRYSGAMVLGNSHVSMGHATSLPQNYIHIGGHHIDEEIKPLPEDLKNIMDNAENGVIYFSMGTNLKSVEWPDVIRKGLLKMFEGLNQTVLWKFEDTIPDLPKNVHILKWAPQSSILSHPNCLFFITHGGLLSTTEVLYFGIPIIGIPVVADQFVNIKRAVSKGFGLKIDLTYNLVQDLKNAIDEMVSNPVYRQKAKELSFIFHDRPVKPSAEISHWVNHVVQTRGAPHLRSPAFHLPLYQRLYLDLIAILLAILIFIFIFLKFVCSLLGPKKKLLSKKKNN